MSNLPTEHQTEREAIQKRFFRAKEKAAEGIIEMGQALLDARDNPQLYPEYQRKGGELNTSKMMKEEFGVARQRAYQLIDFVECREMTKKVSTRVDTFPETREQTRVLTLFKDDEGTYKAIIDRAQEVTNGTLKLSAPQLKDVAYNVTGDERLLPKKKKKGEIFINERRNPYEKTKSYEQL